MINLELAVDDARMHFPDIQTSPIVPPPADSRCESSAPTVCVFFRQWSTDEPSGRIKYFSFVRVVHGQDLLHSLLDRKELLGHLTVRIDLLI